MICKRKPNSGEVLGGPCPECGHLAMLHAGVDACPVCVLVENGAIYPVTGHRYHLDVSVFLRDPGGVPILLGQTRYLIDHAELSTMPRGPLIGAHPHVWTLSPVAMPYGAQGGGCASVFIELALWQATTHQVPVVPVEHVIPELPA